MSESVKARREYGFSEKQNFYKREVAWEPTADIVRRMVAAWHFHQIAEFDRDDQGKPTREYAHLAPNLNGKIAVFYVDGNGFGSIQAGKCSSVTRQQQWDKLVQGQKTAALKAVLDQAWEKKSGDQVGPGWWNKASNMEWRHRFETLLWGGDELLWVVPAWQGWNVARTFFETVRSLQPAEEPPQQGLEVAPAPPSAPLRPAAATGKQGVRNLDAKASKKEREQAEREKQAAVARLLAAEAEARREQASGPAEFGRLSYSAGLVFCHAEAPIQRVWALSKDLAEVAKRVGKTKSAEADKDLVAYAVLESFDQLGQDVHAARTRHLPFPPSNEADETAKRLRQTVLHADDLADGHLLDHIRWMKDHFPHGAVYKLLRVLRTEQEAGPRRSEFRHWLTRATTEIPDAKTNEHLAAFGGRCVGSDRVVLSSAQRINWLHLAELWDYIV